MEQTKSISDPRIVVSPRTDRGVEIFFPTARSLEAQIIMVMVAFGFAAAEWFLWFMGVPLVFRIPSMVAAALVAALVLVSLWHHYFCSVRVTISHGKISADYSVFPFRWQRQVFKKDIESITPTITMRVNERVYYSISMKCRDKKELPMGWGMLSNRDAELIIERIEAALGENHQ